LKKENHLAANLKAYKRERSMTMLECSESLGIPKSTLQTVMKDGNVTLDTLLRISNALGKSLDELVFGLTYSGEHRECKITRNMEMVLQLSIDKKQQLCDHLIGIVELLEAGDGKDDK